MAEKRSETIPREQRSLTRRELNLTKSPFRLIERFADEMDRVFDDFGFGSWMRSPWRGAPTELVWAPDIEVFERNNELVVRADLPGLTKDDVKVDITEDSLILQGERRREHEEEREGMYRSERSYGSFRRAVPLPEGAMTDQAKARFKDGVLEITMPVPPEQVRRGRRLEIGEGEPPRR